MYICQKDIMKPQSIIVYAGILGAIAVIMGAMGAHALKAVLSPEALESFGTGARYNMYHAILLFAIAANIKNIDPKWLKLSVNLTLIGTLLFSGSIYLLSTSTITGINAKHFLGPITPIGGLLLISGWISIVIGAFKAKA